MIEVDIPLQSRRRDKRVEEERRKRSSGSVEADFMTQHRQQVSCGSFPVEKQKGDAPIHELRKEMKRDIGFARARASKQSYALQHLFCLQAAGPRVLLIHDSA